MDPMQRCSFVGMTFPIHQVKNYDFVAGYNDVDEFHRSMEALITLSRITHLITYHVHFWK